MRPATDGLAALSETQRQEMETLLLDFDQTWQPDALVRRVRSLPSDNVSFLQTAILELTKVDLERQWNSGNHRKVEEYLQQYPALGTQETVDVGLLLAEYEARRRARAPAALRDFQLRFPQRFEQLRQLLEQSGASRSAGAASIDTSQSGKVSETMVEGVSRLAKLPKEFGRYRILKRLGEGGMGSVYLGHDAELDRKVALKVPKFEGGENKQLIERFYREARAAANLRHANICPVYDVGETDGTHYISMAYIEGRPLSAYIRSDQAPSQRQVALVVRKLALALQDAHSLGIVHRDLKPANVMIDGKKEPVIMDFGLARQLDKHEDSRLTQQGTVMGSPAYMSPEQVAGDVDRIGPATDIYSLGVILFELLTGRVPYEGPLTAVLGQIMTQEPPGPSEFREDLDPRLASICQRMMARQIEDRYGSMQEAAAALTDYLKTPADETSIAAKPVQTTGGEPRERQESSPIFATPPPQPLRVTVREQPKRPIGVKRFPLLVRVSPKVWVIGVGAAALISLLLLGVMLTVRTAHGTVTIEIDDPNLQLSIDGTEYTISQLEQSQELREGDHEFAIKLAEQTIPIGETIRLKTAEYDGEYRLSVALDEATLTSDRFTVTRDGQQVLRIELHAIPVETTEPERTSGAEMAGGGAAETIDRSDTSNRAADGSTRASQLPFVVTASARPRAPRRVLIFSQTQGYYHECIPLAQRTFRLMGEETGAYTADLNDEDSVWVDLDRYDALFLNNMRRYSFSPAQQSALLEFVREGKGLVLIHSAICTFEDWPEGSEMVGAGHESTPWNDTGTWTVAVEEPDHPLNRAFGGRGFRVNDELFQFSDPYSRDRLRVLLRLDMNDPRNQVGGRSDGDNALSWIREFGKGRVFFCNFGHNDPVYANAAIMQHYLDGIQYALGDLEADATPSAGGGTSALGARTTTQDGWTELFNGVDLSGWTPVGTGDWSVEAGILKADGSGTGWLMSDGEYSNFELEVEYRLPTAGNSGVLLRAWPEGSPDGSDFLEIQLLDDNHPKYSEWESRFAKTGAIFGVVGPVSNTHVESGRWHRMRICATGSQIQVTQDDSQILDAKLSDYPGRLERVSGLTRTNGRIGMQMPMYGTSVEFRAVRLRELGTSAKSEAAGDDDEVDSVPKPQTTPTSSEGWISLFDGKTLNGWRQLMGNATFRVEGGAIVGRLRSGVTKSFLCTEANFTDFLLELEFWIDPDMNSGVQFRSNSLASYKNGVVHGYQVEVNSKGHLTGAIYDEARRSVFLDNLKENTAAQRAFRPGSWNALRVRAVGDSIQTWLNEVPAANVSDAMTKSGFIGLQVHSMGGNVQTKEVRFRNIRLQDLSEPAPDISHARPGPSKRVRWEKENGLAFVRLPDGTWQEEGEDGKTYSFTEARRSAGFVELTGKTEPGVTYRLLSDKALISRRGARYTDKYEGRWSE